VLDRDGIAPYPGTMPVIDLLERHAIPMAIVSSSKNARKVLDAAAIRDRFPVVVDGLTAADEGLVGKPDPAMFLRAAELVGAEARASVVVEDASSGVAAGAAGAFGLVLGVDRGDNLLALLAAGADVVVEDLADTLRPEQVESDE
jgi:HAD superfamily hydrolase (TIGR01509 family)